MPLSICVLPMTAGIAVEAFFPHPIADDGDRVSVAAEVFGGFEPAPQDRMDSQRVEIVGRDDAAGGALGAVADAERGARDPVHDERVERACSSSGNRGSRARRRRSCPDTPRLVPATAIIRSWWATSGNGRSRMPSIQLKTAVVAPMPSVRQRIARIEKPGLRRSMPEAEAHILPQHLEHRQRVVSR